MATRYGLPSARTWTVTQSIDLEHYRSALKVDHSEVVSAPYGPEIGWLYIYLHGSTLEGQRSQLPHRRIPATPGIRSGGKSFDLG